MYQRSNSNAAKCDTRDGGSGILAYRDANVGGTDPENQSSATGGGRPESFSSQSWQQLSTGEQSSGPDQCTQGVMPPVTYSGYVDGTANDANGMSTSSNTDGPSNGPTPNSSSGSGSDNRQGMTGTGHMANSSGRTSFDTSPVHSRQNLSPQEELDAATAAFFQMGPGSGIAPEHNFGTTETAGNAFSIPNGWPGTSGMTPVTDGVLQTLIDMRMDLGWDSST